MPTLARVGTLTGHEERVWCVSWRPEADPPQLASCGSDRTVRVWSVQGEPGEGSSWRLLAELETNDRHSRTLRSVSWSPRGEVLAVASFDSTCSLWKDNRGSFHCVGVVEGHENEVKSSAFSPSGEYFATCSRDKSAFIYEAAKDFEYDCVALLQSHTQDVKMVKWHPEQDVLFTCSYDDTVKVWGPDGDDWSCMETLQAHKSTVWAICFDPVGSRFATCSDDRSVLVWAPAQEAARAAADEEAAQAAEASQTPVRGVAAAAFVTPLFRSVAASAVAPQAPAQRREAPPNATCGWNVTARIEDLHPRPVYSIDWSPNTLSASFTALASACGDNFIRVLQPCKRGAVDGAWECAAEVEAHSGDANCVAWCPTALPGGTALLASAGDDGEVALWRYSP